MRLITVLTLMILLCVSSAAALLILPEKKTLEVSGLVQAKEFKNASQFGGRVQEVLVTEGQAVKAGTPLVTFDDAELRAKILQAKAVLTQTQARHKMVTQGPDSEDIRQAYSRVQQARQNLSLSQRGAGTPALTQVNAKIAASEEQLNTAQKALENAGPMLDEGIISEQKYNDIKAAHAAATAAVQSAKAQQKQLKQGAPSQQIGIARSQLNEANAIYQKVLKGSPQGQVEIAMAEVDQAKSNLQLLESQLSEARLKAPFDGVVQVVNVTAGQLVPPGRPVISILDESNLWTDVYLPESKLAFARAGQPVTLKAKALGNKVFHGKIAYINAKSEYVPGSGNSAEEASFKVKVVIDTAGDDIKLYPGMKVDVRFEREG